jgi:2-oxoglutarate dehydrogenase complex dehydrogenase (E1) component-like enzyme
VQVYYELEAAREAAGKESSIAICRVEQLAPFPFDLVMRELKRYPNAQVRRPCKSHHAFDPVWVFSVDVV